MRRLLRFFLFASSIVLVSTHPTFAAFNQDPGNTCLCPDDPFCTCGGGGSGGGGGGGSPPSGCVKCGRSWVFVPGEGIIQIEICQAATNVGRHRTECYVQPDGACELFGDDCVIVLAGREAAATQLDA